MRGRDAIVGGLAGALFSAGLAISTMTRPEKVIAFLDVTGSWDPSLAFVMVGAISVYAALYRVISKRRRPLFADQWTKPGAERIDARLVAGAAVFGLGWGIAGYCPGPALTSISAAPAALFVIAMVAGAQVARLFRPPTSCG